MNSDLKEISTEHYDYANATLVMEERISNPSINWKVRAEKAEAKIEALELVSLYAEDIISWWPRFTMKGFDVMTGRIGTLKQAIERSKE
jgi:hypothetical protein